jgi:magnesium chelatase family protein
VHVDPVGRVDMARVELGETSQAIRSRVIAARAIAEKRFTGLGYSLNSQIPARSLRTVFQPERVAMNFLHDELEREHITARGLHKIARVSWTLADLHGHEIPTLADVRQAHSMRGGIEI